MIALGTLYRLWGNRQTWREACRLPCHFLFGMMFVTVLVAAIVYVHDDWRNAMYQTFLLPFTMHSQTHSEMIKVLYWRFLDFRFLIKFIFILECDAGYFSSVQS